MAMTMAAAAAAAACAPAAQPAARHAVTPSPPASPTPAGSQAAPSPSPGSTGPTGPSATPAPLQQGLSLAWAPGFTPPAWLPAVIRSAPPAPSGGSTVCGVDAHGLYTALIRYDATSPAGAVTVQVHGYSGPGTYVDAAPDYPVDVEVSPPRSDQSGLSGFQQPATVTVDAGGTSGTVTATLLQGTARAATLSGPWRCA